MREYNKYLCVLHREIHIEDEEFTKLSQLLNDGISLSLGGKEIASYSLSAVFPDIEDLIRVVDYKTNTVLGIVEAYSKSEAITIAKSKFKEIIGERVPYLFDRWIDVVDIHDITY